jgi:hypothetical protein
MRAPAIGEAWLDRHRKGKIASNPIYRGRIGPKKLTNFEDSLVYFLYSDWSDVKPKILGAFLNGTAEGGP